MNWNKHYKLEGHHSILSASDYHWLNDDDEKLEARINSYLARQRGTRLHELAKRLIEERVRLARTKQTLNLYVNDAIGYGMTPEVVLSYSDDFFGTADAICFRDDKLRIHDLKTGKTQASFKQLLIYAGLFCLEYGYKPNEIETELRIYQNDDKQIYIPEPDEISYVQARILSATKLIRKVNDGYEL